MRIWVTDKNDGEELGICASEDRNLRRGRGGIRNVDLKGVKFEVEAVSRRRSWPGEAST